jgi:CBS domain-containing protein
MKAADVMVTNVITVGPDASLQDVARTLLSNRISGVPVIEGEGELVGIVTEGDLLSHIDGGAKWERPWWLNLLANRDALAPDYVKER